MHVLFLTDNFSPETNAPANRTHEHAREWVKAGHRVTVITCAPNFPTGQVFDGYSNRLWQSEMVDGIRVIRVWSYISRNGGFVRRVFDYFSYMITAFFAALPVRGIDVIIGTSPQFFTVCAAWAAATLKGKPFVFELRDIYPESIRAVKGVENSRLLDMMETIELFLYRRAAMVICVTHSFAENLAARGIDPAKLRVVTNGVDRTRFQPRPKDEALISKLGLEDKFVVGYIGTLSAVHGMNTLLDAAKLMAALPETFNMRMIIMGEGGQPAALEARLREEAIGNVLVLGGVSRDEVTRYWSILDLAVIHLRRLDLFKTVIPSKLFECMAMGIPVLHAVEGESAQIVTCAGMGVTVEPENPEKMATAIGALISAPERLQLMAQAGISAASQYDRSILARNMMTLLEEVAFR